MFDLRRVARMYGVLAMACREVGEAEAAVRYAMRSVVVLEVLRDRVALARSENSLALVLMARGDLDGARIHLDRSLELSAGGALGVGRSAGAVALSEPPQPEGKGGQAFGLARGGPERPERHE